MTPPVAALPVFLLRGGRRAAQDVELRHLPEAALHLGETGEAGQGRDRIPEANRVLIGGNPGDHRAEEGQPVRWLKGDDRRADVPAGSGQRKLGLILQHGASHEVSSSALA